MIEDLLRGWAAMEAALPDYEAAQRYYTGKIDEVFASERIRQQLAETGRRYRFNLAKIPVEQLADRIELVAVTAPDQTTINEEIEAIWQANDLDVHYADLVLKTCEYGDAYMMVWPVDDEDGLDQALTQAGVQFSVHAPLHARMMYDPENPRRKDFFIQRWEVREPDGTDRWYVILWYVDRFERWRSRQGGALTEAAGWELDERDDDLDPVVEHAFGNIPFFHHRIKTLPYGTPAHYAGYGCQDAVNKSLITQLTTTDSHGFPQRYALTDTGAELSQNNDGPDFPEDDQATLDGSIRGGQSSNLRGGPGVLLELTGKKAVGQFAAADPAAFLDPAAFYIRLMAQLTGTPLHYFDPTGGVPSGESLKVADAPLARSADRAQTMLHSPVVETWQFALDLAGAGADIPLDIRWAPSHVATSTDDWTVVQAKQAAGVPQDKTLVEAGYEPSQVRTWLDQEAEAMDLNRRVALLNTMADAIQKLGAATALGAIDQATVNALVNQLMPQAVPAPGSEEAA